VEGKARAEGKGLLPLGPPFGAGRQTGKNGYKYAAMI